MTRRTLKLVRGNWAAGFASSVSESSYSGRFRMAVLSTRDSPSVVSVFDVGAMRAQSLVEEYLSIRVWYVS